MVVEAAKRSGHRNVGACDDWSVADRELVGEVRDGDVILTLGAGDIYRLAQKLVREEETK